MKRLLTTMALLLATPATAQTVIDDSDQGLEPQVQLLYVRLLDELPDPWSAVVRGLFYNEEIQALCGEINAKNTMGAYTGFTPFMYLIHPEATGFALAARSTNEAIAVSTFCTFTMDEPAGFGAAQ